MDKMTLEQICNQAGYNLPNNEIQTQNNLSNNLSENSQDLSGGVLGKIKTLGSAVTWFPRKVFNVALNTTGLDKIISYNSPGMNQTPQPENNINSNNNSNSNNNVYTLNKSNSCVENIDELCNSCSEPTQLIDLHNKVVTKLKI